MPAGPAEERRQIRVGGIVQGVGLRPFVHRKATALGLSGAVANDEHGVVIDVQGSVPALDELQRCLTVAPPPRARVISVVVTTLVPRSEVAGFTIEASRAGSAGSAPVRVGADLGVCDPCLVEVFDPADRRYRYPFTNCTNCGPRYSIVRQVPYDRARTTMAGFTMCSACQQEYDDPTDRRFHAQPNACPACGPTLAYERPGVGAPALGDEALVLAAAALRGGGIVAVKGIGGYHLAVLADDDEAVATLRRRKHRDEKPFAVLVRDEEEAGGFAEVDEAAADALASWRAPVVLCPRRREAKVAAAVAPDLPELGLVLAYTPLHHLLLAEVGRPLVLTSANVTDEPIAHRDDDARARLAPLADGLLTHDRGIHVACEDSVVRSTGGGLQVLRRGRGYAPEPLRLPLAADPHPPVLAVGAELKSTISVARRGEVVTSPHLGDLEHPAAYTAFVATATHLCDLFAVRPAVLVHDAHPEYLSTKWARDTELPTLAVQHHHAHVASCLVDHGRAGPVIGLAFDGLGYGDDGTLWGGEVLVADLVDSQRLAHLRPVVLPGGAAAIREPWRMAVAWAAAAVDAPTARAVAQALDPRGASLLGLVERADPPGGPVTTSVGRLLDAVAALVGGRRAVTYEGQAAVELEAMARRVPRSGAPRYPVVVDDPGEGRPLVLDPRPMVAEVVAARAAGVDAAVIAAGVHEGLGRAAGRLAADLAARHGVSAVALTGGVFQNVRLTEVVADQVAAAGLEVLCHRSIPPNDGGISVGQAAVAVARSGPLPSATSVAR